MPTSSAEMTSFYAAFRADDTLVEIIPSFDFAGTLPAHSSVPSGPFKAGMTAAVPLWMALFLQQRSLASICPPVWLNIGNLVEIIAFEKKHVSLFPTDDASRLPADYYEISKRLTSTKRNTFESADAIALLVQDLLELRLDKLRQQFQSLLTETVTTTDLTVAVTGIGTQELAILQTFVTRALADVHFLAQTEDTTAATTTAVTAAASAAAVAASYTENGAAKDLTVPVRRSRVPLRRFRS